MTKENLTNAEKIECVKMLNESLDKVFYAFVELFPEIKIEKRGDLMFNEWACRLVIPEMRSDFGV